MTDLRLSSFSSTSKLLHVGFVLGLMEGLQEDDGGGQESDI